MALITIITQTGTCWRLRHNLAASLQAAWNHAPASAGPETCLGVFLEDNKQPVFDEPESERRYPRRHPERPSSPDRIFRLSLYFSQKRQDERQALRLHDAPSEPLLVVVPFDWKPFRSGSSEAYGFDYDARLDLFETQEDRVALTIKALPSLPDPFREGLLQLAKSLLDELSRPRSPSALKSPQKPPPCGYLDDGEKSRLKTAADTLLGEMAKGECYLANLTTILDVPKNRLSSCPLHLIRRWAVSPSRFAWRIRARELSFDCYSPERFFRVSDGHLITEPIKGTAPFVGDASLQNLEAKRAANALWSSLKERCEQHLVTDLLRNDMASLCEPGSIDVTHPLSIRLTSGLCQMSSRIEGRLADGASLFAILEAMLPAGSVTGTPKSAVTPLLKHLETRARGLYCGLCIDFDPLGDTEATLLIRGIFEQNGLCSVGTGSGLTILSDPQAEVDEMETKIHSFLSRCFDQ